MTNATATVRNRFASVWVLWKGKAYNTWRNGLVGNGKVEQPNPQPTL